MPRNCTAVGWLLGDEERLDGGRLLAWWMIPAIGVEAVSVSSRPLMQTLFRAQHLP